MEKGEDGEKRPFLGPFWAEGEQQKWEKMGERGIFRIV